MPPRKKPAASTVLRESDLISALARSNRRVTPETLASWRKRGLMPPFDIKGTARARVFHWKDHGVIGRAEYIFDALSQGCSLGETYTGLWIAGYDVPLNIFRRSWRSWLRTSSRWQVSRLPAEHATGAASNAYPEFELSLLQLLSKSLVVVEGFSSFEVALNRMTRMLGADSQPVKTESLLLLYSLMLAFERSDLLENTPDQALARAQQHLVNLMAALNTSAVWENGEHPLRSARSVHLSIEIGSPLLWIILSLMHSGHEARLESSSAALSEFIDGLQSSPNGGKRSEGTDGEGLRRARARLAELWRPHLIFPLYSCLASIAAAI